MNPASYQINHINSEITVKPRHLEIEKTHVDTIVKQMSIKYAESLNQSIIKIQKVFSARFG